MSGWTFPWAVTAVRGTHYCLRRIDYPEIWRLLKEEHITHFNAAPTVNTLLCNDSNAERLADPVRVTVAASPPTPHLFKQMIKLNLHPVHVYGMTETYGPITKGYHMPEWDDLPEEEKYHKMARQGHGFVTSLPIRVIKTDQIPYGHIVDVEPNGREVGEIAFCGNICAKGYYKDAEATRKLFAGGVLHSGDLAVMHPDGSAQILDRAKDIIISGKSNPFPSCVLFYFLFSPPHFLKLDCFSLTVTSRQGGENISSLALEARLVTHSHILEAGVVAVPDEQWGERPKAYVTLQPGKQLEGEELIRWARSDASSGISGFMVPREVVVVEELPKTSTGKIKKGVLREWARGGRVGEDG